jgi:hypothetical protein
MKIPFWRLLLCYLGVHGPEEPLYNSHRHKRAWSSADKARCLLCGRVRRLK